MPNTPYRGYHLEWNEAELQVDIWYFGEYVSSDIDTDAAKAQIDGWQNAR